MKNKKLLVLTLIGIFFLTSGLGCKTDSAAASFKPVTLEYWGVFENPDDIALLTGPYTARHPKVTINYRKFREDEYKQKLLEAWALGNGPDLFMVPNTSVHEYLKFMEPMPATMVAPVQYVTGTLKKEIVTKLQTYNGLTPKQVADTFLDVVAGDVVVNNRVYALPYSVDTLSVFYNKALLKSNNIPLPAKDWNELIQQAGIISKVDAKDHLVQSAIAMGTTNNISAAFDILSAIMMQIKIPMSDSSGPVFQSNTDTLNALQFYLSFARTGLQNYSWSKDLPDALDAFTAGKLAYFIGYPYQAQIIRDTNPRLDWDITPLFTPENVETPPTYANYWVTAVAKPRGATDAKTDPEVAWQYLLESTQAQNVKPFLDNASTPRTTALRSLVTEETKDAIRAPFAKNLLQATSWYQGYNYTLAKRYFLEMIDNVDQAYKNGVDPQSFMNAGASLIAQTYQQQQ